MTTYLWGVLVGFVIGAPAGALYVMVGVTTGRWLGRKPKGVCGLRWTSAGGELAHICKRPTEHQGRCHCVCGHVQGRRA